MYNIDIYSYWKKPFSKQSNKTRYFSIHPLDEPGKHKMFFTDESHLVHYLKRTDPFVFKSIVGCDYETLVKQQEEKIKKMEQLRNETNNFQNLNNTNNNNTQQLNQTNRMHVTNYENEKQNYIDDNNINNTNYNTNFNEFQNETRKNRPQSSINSGYRKKKNFKDIYGYEQNTNFKNNEDRTLYEINNLKKYGLVEEEKVKPNYSKFGFDSTNVPVFKTNRPQSSTMRNFNNSLAKSVGFNQSGLDENQRMRNNLFNQTSRAFCQKHKLPNLAKIAGQRQVIRNMKIGNSKEMGEKYFPEAFIPPTKNRTGRNYVGDLFKH
jgi:hypothetical protein